MHWQTLFHTTHHLHSALSIKSKAEKHSIKSGYTEVYNELFCVEELRDALHRSHDTAVGPDNVHYLFLKHLPESSILILLNIFNKIWTAGCFPSDWRKAIIIPIPKLGKDPARDLPAIALPYCSYELHMQNHEVNDQS